MTGKEIISPPRSNPVSLTWLINIDPSAENEFARTYLAYPVGECGGRWYNEVGIHYDKRPTARFD
jgi:hypothetical protein